ncbi:hypothetical protein E4V42_07300 [Clostridium estertheticum]|uniref:RES domain-containing protein n=1 Tax=Clostridium estertheticum TaxID=238834 RepID=A0A5N7ILV0_9CLOT|nr:hypothetical protein [Clostridium estertheticum]MPQ31242.1 hypothetical protein [Clostridium estertheticum]MPQ61916.1 hypothetical protein [Clostridium estertheticum]
MCRTQRYSIPGLPSIYLGSSVYVCWEELDRPDKDEMQECKLLTKTNNYKILDFAFRPSKIAEIIRYELDVFNPDESDSRTIYLNNVLSSRVTLWPLIAACSIMVSDKNDSFKPEYIIPQLLLQWVRLKPDYKGIRYFSVMVDYSIQDYLCINYVFPAITYKQAGLCSNLMEMFKISETLTWKETSMYQHIDLGESSNSRFNIELIKGMKRGYHDTLFCRIEDVLDKMKTYDSNI